MIQFNLLPDVKLEYIKAQRMRRLMLAAAVLVSGVSLALFIFLIGANQLGKKHLNDLSRDINSQSKTLQSEPQINTILTIQNQLNSLSALHGTKPAVPRLFDYLNRLTPLQISINNYTSDFTAQSVTVVGTSDALSSVNQYVDTLKYTKYVVKDDPNAASKPAFTSVVLSSFGLVTGAEANKAASFSINFTYDPAIFDITKSVDLSIPNLITTRSNTGQITDLFTAAPTPAAIKSSGSSR